MAIEGKRNIKKSGVSWNQFYVMNEERSIFYIFQETTDDCLFSSKG